MSRIFDDYSEVKECTNCEHWWTNACDGDNVERPCNSYVACRRIAIPEQIKALDKRLKYLGSAAIVLAVINLILWVVYIRG